MVERLRYKPLVRELLHRDALWNAIPIHRVFRSDREHDAYVDRMQSPRAVMTQSRFEPKVVSLSGIDEDALLCLLNSLHGGKEYRFHAIDVDAARAIRRDFEITSDNPSWFYTLEAKDFVGKVDHEIVELKQEDAEEINKYWNPGEDSTGYIRSRIKDGPAFGIRIDGELVAWDATHMEIDEAVMLGFLFVKEEHRHKGYAMSMATTMVRAVLEKGKTPICHIFTDNEPSVRLTEQMGFKRRGEQVWLRAVKP